MHDLSVGTPGKYFVILSLVVSLPCISSFNIPAAVYFVVIEQISKMVSGVFLCFLAVIFCVLHRYPNPYPEVSPSDQFISTRTRPLNPTASRLLKQAETPAVVFFTPGTCPTQTPLLNISSRRLTKCARLEEAIWKGQVSA